MHRARILERQIHPDGGESYYDILDDWELIESSFLKQYGIRLSANEDMTWREFCSLLSGIMPDTPLGQIVSIRAEKDPKVIKKFSKEQKRIRSEWIARKYKDTNSQKAGTNMLLAMQEAFKKAYGLV